ncbi:DNA helicase-2/ATP-dependent DNA helicase PcrA [Haloactinomyces albus]|uniref:DNA 3'-5' helicase n=1 Tax=Haloactinomyces albus TaxID=1352928 RepID=A0AAE4CP99_9ACTN|nr:UvrD-helicase domain-containing protein [Haloactinomyces albus]MDR7302892.1 DNA helicase-2/ATP-dependent DNA helicase PcrA [Haloactinomyces albus]
MISPQRIAEALGLHPPTPEQAAVIGAPAEPALVVAGAGAGKTETMAARVVWLVANGLVTPERVLGLTFTRKAARQLADRVRARLRRLAGSGLLDEVDPSGELRALVLAGEPTVLTYHAYAGRLVGEHGLRVPVEPGARLLTETAAWQLAHSVVSTWTEDLDTDKVPATVTEYVLSLAGELAEHLTSPEQVVGHAERLCRIVESAPPGKGQRAAPSQELQKVPAAQRLRTALLPLLDEYGRRKRREAAMDFADQMSLAARLADEHPEVSAGERDRFGAVLLDEYQDTGHAQRVLLRALFGRAETPMPVTAVGDPAQAIYGWRGASAANLPRFATDFPCRRTPSGDEAGDFPDHRPPAAELAPARRYGLMTSFRNPPEVLRLANAVSEPLRAAGLEVDELRARDGAGPGDIRCALVDDIRSERDWLADRVAAQWQETLDRTGKPPTAAVLVRRRADMADLAAALRARGLPVEVVGLGGLLDEPEVRDLVSALRVLVDPLAGTAAMRLLTGARWRIGAADLAALWERAQELGTRSAGARSETPLSEESAPEDADATVAEALPGESAEQAGLVDALDDPGEPERYSQPGFRRIRRLGGELAALRRRLEQPLPELVADVERTLLLDIESLARPGGVGRAHLDALAGVVAEFATASPAATLPALLDYLDSAERAEDGLEPGEVEVAEDRVQVLTAHAAKGLEWQVVAVPHLVDGVFPGKRKSSCWLRSVTELPAELRGDAEDLPRLDLGRLEGMDRKELTAELDRHDADFEERRLTEERRLLYVALTRSEHTLLVSGHWWGEGSGKPKGPSGFLREFAEVLGGESAPGIVEHWAPAPDGATANPLTEATRSIEWPADPLGERRDAVAGGADLVRAALADPGMTEGADPADAGLSASGELSAEGEAERWARDVDVLLAERDATARQRDEVALPDHLSVSRLVELADDRDALARRLRRPLPLPPNPTARRGTAFHAWLEHRFTSTALLDIDELPGAADDSAASDSTVEELRQAFLAGSWADRTPHRVEVPFETRIDGVAIRGRMDAVFADPDGGWTVVDWKTGAVPGEDRVPVLSVQLAAYRLAWSELSGAPLDEVRAAFHYVRHDRTLRPADLLDADGLRALLASVPAAE